MPKRRLLFLAPRTPYPLTAGYRLRIDGLARLLARRFEVHLVCLDTVPAGAGVPFASVTALPNSSLARALRAGWHALRGLPLQVGGYLDRRAMARLRATTGAFDLCYLFQVRTAPFVDAMSPPAVLDYVDAVSMHYRDAEAVAGGFWRLFYALEGERLRRYEAEVRGRFRGTFVGSPIDRRYLLEAAPGTTSTPVDVLPMGVRADLLAYPRAAEEPGWIVMMGRMAYYPNSDAAEYFARRVFPLLRRRDGALRFLIVGADPPLRVRRLAAIPGVHVTGYVDDPWAHAARASVVVGPVRMGAGVQNKVLEGMALARPVVATSLAVRGVEGALDGEHLVVADQPEEMADAVWSLLTDADRRRRIGQAARRLIEERYTWEQVGVRLFASLDRWV